MGEIINKNPPQTTRIQRQETKGYSRKERKEQHYDYRGGIASALRNCDTIAGRGFEEEVY